MASTDREWGDLQQNADKNMQLAENEIKPRAGSRRKSRRQAALEAQQTAKPEEKTADDKLSRSTKSGGWAEQKEGADNQDPKEKSSEDKKITSKGFFSGRRRVNRRTPLDKPSSKQSESKNPETTETRRMSTQNAFEEDDDDDDGGKIMIIPDLDDDQEEDLQLTVAEAPQNIRTVQSLRELDNKIRGIQLPENMSDSGFRVDLSILTKTLVPRNKIIEQDVAWDFEQLLEEVSQGLTKEKEESMTTTRAQQIATS
uniref:Intraflagellar transport protein 43 homolog n=1 Tax=Aplanochytrium stocchinoi TaxID=215587 RepID=A0A7S3LQI1_9STRA